MQTPTIHPRALLDGVEGEPELQRGTAMNSLSTSSDGKTPALSLSSLPVAKRGFSCLKGNMLYGVEPVVDDVSNATP